MGDQETLRKYELTAQLADDSIRILEESNSGLQTKLNRILAGVLAATSTLGVGCLLPIQGVVIGQTLGVIVTILCVLSLLSVYVVAKVAGVMDAVIPIGDDMKDPYDDIINRDIESAYGNILAIRSIQIKQELVNNKKLGQAVRTLLGVAFVQLTILAIGILSKAFGF